MNPQQFLREVKCSGSVTVGPRGQVVIPANVRREMAIDTGETLLVFIGPGKKGLMLVKTEAVEELLTLASQHLASIEKVLRMTTTDLGQEGS